MPGSNKAATQQLGQRKHSGKWQRQTRPASPHLCAARISTTRPALGGDGAISKMLELDTRNIETIRDILHNPDHVPDVPAWLRVDEIRLARGKALYKGVAPCCSARVQHYVELDETGLSHRLCNGGCGSEGYMIDTNRPFGFDRFTPEPAVAPVVSDLGFASDGAGPGLLAALIESEAA